ncbi:MAG TPA: ornithine cyclodeaminase family protein [Allosphingosinicella sp.]|nr:ornithine cyclodeaminase family protein [Allosphingosinicella sp.]
MTLLLSRADIAALMRPADYLDAVEAGLRSAEQGLAMAPPPLSLAGDGGKFHAKGASLRLQRLLVALKLNGNFPDNPAGRPTIQGAILLCDGGNGSLLAVMDSIEVTLRRTAAASALAARFLARPDSRVLLVCGCGAQAVAQLEALAEILPLRRCFAWDRDSGKAEALAQAARVRGLDAAVAAELGDAALASDVIVTCTTAREPFLTPGQVRPGSFVAAVGADSPDKNEVHPALMREARVVVDVLDQCLAMGDLGHAVRAGAMRAEDVHARLGAIVAGAATGRTSDDQIFIFDSTGTALQDVAAAAAIYERACRRDGYASFAFGRAA